MNPEPNPNEPSGIQEAVLAATEKVKETKISQDLEAEAKPPILTRPPVIGAVALIFVAVVAWNVNLLLTPTPPPTPVEEAAVLPTALFAASQSVEAFRSENGRLPNDLEEAGLQPGSFQYRIAGDEYFLSAQGSHTTQEYRGSEGVETLLGQMEVIYGGGISQ